MTEVDYSGVETSAQDRAFHRAHVIIARAEIGGQSDDLHAG